MPDLNKIPVPPYTGAQPYHANYDNIPIEVLAQRDFLINGEVDYQSQVLKDAAGDQGNVANRISQSIEENGNLKTTAIDDALHSIANHTDGTIEVETDELEYYTDTLGYTGVTNPVSFVRMLESERDKLALIADDATNLLFQVETISNITLFEEGTLKFAPSDSIHWEITAPDIIKPVLSISTDFAHRHYYDIEPVTSNYIDFSVNVSETPYVEGSLRVYINGIRLSSDASVYYPSNPVSTWSLNTFIPDHEAGTFELDTAITEDDIIRIDFEVSLT